MLAVAEREGIRVPELWAREVANGLALAYRRKRIASGDKKVFLAALARLSITVEHANSVATAVGDAAASAIRYGLTAYDPAYVDLAVRKGLTLATLDRAMRRTAQESRVTIFTR